MTNPVLDSLFIQREPFRLAGRYRIKETQALNVAAITLVPTVGNHDMIEGALLRAAA
jgi:hypothetical protein